jgi:hypothetical protein
MAGRMIGQRVLPGGVSALRHSPAQGAGLGLRHYMLGIAAMGASSAVGAHVALRFKPPVAVVPPKTMWQHGLSATGPMALLGGVGIAYTLYKFMQKDVVKTQLKGYRTAIQSSKGVWQGYHADNLARSIRLKDPVTGKKGFIPEATQHIDYQNRTNAAAQNAVSTYKSGNKSPKTLRKERVKKAETGHLANKPAKYDQYHKAYKNIFNKNKNLDAKIKAATAAAEAKFKEDNPQYAQVLAEIQEIKTKHTAAYKSEHHWFPTALNKDGEKAVNASSVAEFRKKNIERYRQFKQDEEKCIKAKREAKRKLMETDADAKARKEAIASAVTQLKKRYTAAELKAINDFDEQLKTKMKEANKAPSVEDVKKYRQGASEAARKSVEAESVPEAVKLSRTRNEERYNQAEAKADSLLNAYEARHPKELKAHKNYLKKQIKSLEKNLETKKVKSKTEKGKTEDASPAALVAMNKQVTVLKKQLEDLDKRVEARATAKKEADKAKKEADKAKKEAEKEAKNAAKELAKKLDTEA